jgi:LacI family transcriptional regulator
VITAPVFQKESHAFAASCHQNGIQLILINDDLRSDYQLSYIGQDAFKCGMVAAHLMSLSVKDAADYLLLSVARERDNDQHIQQREEGFLAFWNGSASKCRCRILSHSIPNGSYIYVKRSLADLFRKNPGLSGIFVTSSRVYQVARYLQNTGREKVLLIGYDLISPNIKYLNLGVIDFLISQKPREQGYRSMITAFNVIRLNKQTRPSQIIPIDIITRENFCCYET